MLSSRCIMPRLIVYRISNNIECPVVNCGDDVIYCLQIYLKLKAADERSSIQSGIHTLTKRAKTPEQTHNSVSGGCSLAISSSSIRHILPLQTQVEKVAIIAALRLEVASHAVVLSFDYNLRFGSCRDPSSTCLPNFSKIGQCGAESLPFNHFQFGRRYPPF